MVEMTSDRRFRLIVEAAPNAMVMVDGEGLIALVNAKTEQVFGYPRAELLGRPVEMLVPERFRRQHPGLRAAFFKNPAARPMGAGRDLYGRKQNGSEFPIEIGLNPIDTDEGTMVLSAIIDITERKAAESSLRESEHRSRSLAAIVESSDDAIISNDLEGVVTSWNKSAERIFGYTADEMIGQSILRLAIPGHGDDMIEILNRIKRGERVDHYETKRRRRDGSTVLRLVDRLSDLRHCEQAGRGVEGCAGHYSIYPSQRGAEGIAGQVAGAEFRIAACLAI